MISNGIPVVATTRTTILAPWHSHEAWRCVIVLRGARPRAAHAWGPPFETAHLYGFRIDRPQQSQTITANIPHAFPTAEHNGVAPSAAYDCQAEAMERARSRRRPAEWAARKTCACGGQQKSTARRLHGAGDVRRVRSASDQAADSGPTGDVIRYTGRTDADPVVSLPNGPAECRIYLRRHDSSGRCPRGGCAAYSVPCSESRTRSNSSIPYRRRVCQSRSGFPLEARV